MNPTKYTILHTESSTGWGGQEIRILNESEGMIRRGHRVMLACQPGSVISERAPDRGIETIIMPIGGASDIKAVRHLWALIRKERVDIVNTHSSKDSWCAGIAAKFCGRTKAIRTRHLGASIRTGFDTRVAYSYLPDAVITTGVAIKEHVIDRTEVSSEKVVSIPTGIDLSMFDREKADRTLFRRDIGVDPDTPLIGTVAMLRRVKGHKYLLDAAAQVLQEFPQARFVIVGDIAFQSNIKDILAKQMADLGIQDKVIMAGYRSDVANVMAALDIFVLPSLEEGVPQSITQAAAMKLPVVGTKVGSVYEQIINCKTGFLIDPADSEQIKESVLALLHDPAMAKQMGENGRRLVEEKFSISRMLNDTEALYHNLMDGVK